MKKYRIFIYISLLIVFTHLGCKSNDDQLTQPISTFKLDGVWQAYIFNNKYPFTQFLAHLRTNGTELRGEIQSDCFDLFMAKQIPFIINSGSYTDTDISFNFIMETTIIAGHFFGNLKDNPAVKDGKEIVGHIYFEYSGTLTNNYPIHLVKQSITYLPKSVNE